MNKTRFLEILSNPVEMSDFEVQELESLAESMPYSQPVHIALAIKKNHNVKDDHQAAKAIKNASLFAFNRRRLKGILENGLPPLPLFSHPEESHEEVITEPEVDQTPTYDGQDVPEQAFEPMEEPAEEISLQTEEQTEQSLPIEELSEPQNTEVHSEIEETLRQLKESRENAEKLDEPYDANTHSTEKESILTDDTEEPVVTPVPDQAFETETGSKDYLSPDEPDLNPATNKPAGKDRRREQMQLIDQFIEKSPSISKADKYGDGGDNYEGKDLSSNTVDITDNTLVSENLANIMVRQGKIDRAIDIYKKLIWKFPQKKSYFASRIEELKSNG